MKCKLHVIMFNCDLKIKIEMTKQISVQKDKIFDKWKPCWQGDTGGHGNESTLRC